TRTVLGDERHRTRYSVPSDRWRWTADSGRTSSVLPRHPVTPSPRLFPESIHAASPRLPRGDATSLAVLAVRAASAAGLRTRRGLARRHAARHAPQRRRRLAALGPGDVRPQPALLCAGAGRDAVPRLELAPLLGPSRRPARRADRHGDREP